METKSSYADVLRQYVKEIPTTPSGPNYQSSRKLKAEECLSDNDDLACTFHLSEAVSATLRTMAVYRDDQIKNEKDKTRKITSFIKPISELINQDSEQNSEDVIQLPPDADELIKKLSNYKIDDEEPLHKRYLRFSQENNVENFKKILKELPKEWTIIQLTAPYNPNENLKPYDEYKTEMSCIYLSVLTNDYFEGDDPFTVVVPANVTQEGEIPLFKELYSLLEDNYKTIENAQFLNNKRLVQNYWSKREDIDLRMKSVINVMDKDWLGGWVSLLAGKLEDNNLKDRVKMVVDNAISDWGFIRLTRKQRVLLYNLTGICSQLTSGQIKSCIIRILLENGNPDDIRQHLDIGVCQNCSTEFDLVTELCTNCLTKCFEAIHNLSVLDGVEAFSDVATQVREYEEWATLRKASRHPVILIVDELLDQFPWESLPVISSHPVSRMENIHFLYNLYKVYENKMKDGYLTLNANNGRYVINPEKNLDRMEKRMSTFVKYWCGRWRGDIGQQPTPDNYMSYLTEADLFLYCGHGDGMSCPNGANSANSTNFGVSSVEGGAVRAACLLSGCGSGRVRSAGGRAPHSAAHLHLHVGHCPMVIGMLWEVTDLEVDKVVSSLLGACVPSDAPVPWDKVGKKEWSLGKLDLNVEVKSKPTQERNLLIAVAKSKKSTNYIMIASSMVARGLPVMFTGDADM